MGGVMLQSHMGKGKLGGSKKGIRLIMLLFEEAELHGEVGWGQGQQRGGGKVTTKV